MINPIKIEKENSKIDTILESVLQNGKSRSKAICNTITYMFMDAKNKDELKKEAAFLLKDDKKFLSEAFITLTQSELGDFLDTICQVLEYCEVTPGDIVYCVESEIPRRYTVGEYEIITIMESKNIKQYSLCSTADKDKTKLITQNQFFKTVFFYKEDAEKAIANVEELEKIVSDGE